MLKVAANSYNLYRAYEKLRNGKLCFDSQVNKISPRLPNISIVMFTLGQGSLVGEKAQNGGF